MPKTRPFSDPRSGGLSRGFFSFSSPTNIFPPSPSSHAPSRGSSTNTFSPPQRPKLSPFWPPRLSRIPPNYQSSLAGVWSHHWRSPREAGTHGVCSGFSTRIATSIGWNGPKPSDWSCETPSVGKSRQSPACRRMRPGTTGVSPSVTPPINRRSFWMIISCRKSLQFRSHCLVPPSRVVSPRICARRSRSHQSWRCEIPAGSYYLCTRGIVAGNRGI